MRSVGVFGSVVALLLAAPMASAATISFTGSAAAATPFATANSGVTTGSVLWNGAVDVITTATGLVTGATLTAATVYGVTAPSGTDNVFRLVFNANEPPSGPNHLVDVCALQLLFAKADGSTLFTATAGAQTVLGNPAQSYGYLVTLSQAEASSFFADPANRLGISFTLGNNEGQADSFGIQRALPGNPTVILGEPVPEPATLATLGVLVCVGGLRARRRSAVVNRD